MQCAVCSVQYVVCSVQCAVCSVDELVQAELMPPVTQQAVCPVNVSAHTVIVWGRQRKEI